VAHQSNQALTEAHRLRKTDFQTVFAPTSGVGDSRGSLRTTKQTYNARAICVSTSAASAASEESDTPKRRTPFFRFDDAAFEELTHWRENPERRLRSHELSPAIEGHFAKYRKLVPALALINHLADGGKG
jgi:hypothetical protein